MHGILLKVNGPEFEAVASEGHRLSMFKTNSTTGGYTGLPHVDALNAVLPVLPKTGRRECSTVGRYLRFEWDSGSALVRCLAIEYPKYERVIPDPGDAVLKVAFDRRALLDAVNQIRPFAREADAKDLLTVRYNDRGNDNGDFRISASTADQGDVAATIQVLNQDRRPQKDIEWGLNGFYIAQILGAMPCETVTFESGVDGLRPVVFADPNADHRVVLMPVKV